MEQTYQTQNKIVDNTVGQIKVIHIKVEGSMKMDLDINLNNKTGLETAALTLLCGKNGSGKTVVMVNTWCLGMIAQSIIAMSTNKIINSSSVTDIAQTLYDNSFTEQDYDGTIGCEFTSGATIEVKFDKGKIVSVNHANFDTITRGTQVIYLSSNTRLFNNIKHYLSSRKIILASNGNNKDYMFQTICDSYKIYDASFIEGLIHKCPITIKDDMYKTLKDSYDFEDHITEVNVDLDKCDFIATMKDGSIKPLTRYSNGHQAILCMFLAQI